MPKYVEVQGVGMIAFPDEASDEQIGSFVQSDAFKQRIASTLSAPQQAASDQQVENAELAATDEPQSEFTKGLVGGLFEQNPQMVSQTLAGLADLTGIESMRSASQYFSELAQTDNPQQYAAAIPSIANIKGLEDTWDYVAYALGQSISSTVPVLAGAGAGAAVGAVTPIPGGALIGAGTGAIASSFTLNYGDTRQELIENKVPEEQASQYALPAGVIMSGLDALSGLGLLKPLTEPVKNELRNTIVKRIAHGVAQGAILEGGTEALQDAVQQSVVAYAAEKDLFTTENGVRLLDSMIQGAIGGAAISGVTTAASTVKDQIKSPDGGEIDTSNLTLVDPADSRIGSVVNLPNSEDDTPESGTFLGQVTYNNSNYSLVRVNDEVRMVDDSQLTFKEPEQAATTEPETADTPPATQTTIVGEEPTDTGAPAGLTDLAAMPPAEVAKLKLPKALVDQVNSLRDQMQPKEPTTDIGPNDSLGVMFSSPEYQNNLVAAAQKLGIENPIQVEQSLANIEQLEFELSNRGPSGDQVLRRASKRPTYAKNKDAIEDINNKRAALNALLSNFNQKPITDWAKHSPTRGRKIRKDFGLPIEGQRLAARTTEQSTQSGGESKSTDVNIPEVSFQTAKGSLYQAYPDGTTKRNKAARDDYDHRGDKGEKPRSAVTLYLDPEVARNLAPPTSGWRMYHHNDGTVSLLTEYKGQWGISPGQRQLPVSTRPEKGLIPLELWDVQDIGRRDGKAYKRIHFGNEIVSITPNKPKARVRTPEETKQAAARNEIKRALTDQLSALGLSDVALNLPERLTMEVGGKSQDVDGAYTPRIISVALDSNDPTGVLDHEVIHALRDMNLFTPAEWKLLESAAPTWRRMFGIDQAYGDLTPAELNEEAIAEAFRRWKRGDLNPSSRIGQLFERLRLFLEALRNALVGLGYQNSEQVFNRIAAGQIGRRPRISQKQIISNAAYMARMEPTAFQRWFGNSVIRNPDGSPRVMYHATRYPDRWDAADLTPNMNPAEFGFHIGTQEQANFIATNAARLDYEENAERQSHILPLFVKLENPIRIPDLGLFSPTRVLRELNSPTSPVSEQDHDMLTQKLSDTSDITKQFNILKSYLKSKGYDGFVYRNLGETVNNIEDSYIVFEPSQVKSVMNTGTWDTGNPNFMASVKFDAPENIDPRYQENVTAFTEGELKRAKARLRNIRDKTQLPTDMTLMGQIFYTMRHVAQHPVFGKVFARIYVPIQKRREDRMQLIDDTSQLLRPLGNLSRADRINFGKAAEIMLTEGGTYRPNQNGEIIFVAGPQGSIAADSTIQPGEVIVLRGEAANAYVNAQKAMQLILDANKAAFMANQADFFKTLASKFFPNTEFTQDSVESMTYEEINMIYNDLQGRLQAVNFVPEGAQRPETADAQIRDLEKALEVITPLRKAIGEYERLRQSDYFPMMRHGDYGVTVHARTEGGKKGELLHFETLEFGAEKFVPGQRNRKASQLVAKLQREYPNAIVSEPFVMSYDSMKQQLGDVMFDLNLIAGMLDGNQKDAFVKASKDLEEKMTATGFAAYLRPRSKVPGFSPDLIRALAKYIESGAQSAVNTRYNPQIREAQGAALRTAPPRLRDFINDAVDYSLNPTEEFDAFRAFQFYWYLGGNISSALIQIASIPQYSVGYQAMFSGSFAKSLRIHSKALSDATKVLFAYKDADTPYIREYNDLHFNFAKLPSDIRDAVIKAVERGIIKQFGVLEESGISSASQTLGAAAELRRGRDKFVQKFLARPFSTMETLSRMVAFISTYRLAKNDPRVLARAKKVFADNPLFQEITKGEPDPFSLAAFHVEDILGVYGKTNRPRYMQGIGAVILQFQSYIHQMFELMFRMVRGNYGPEGRVALASILGMLFLTAGSLGMPGGEDILNLADWIIKTYSGVDKDLAFLYRQFLLDTTKNDFAADVIRDGLFNAMGVDISKRIGMGNLPGSDVISSILGSNGTAESALGVPGSLIIGNTRNFYEQMGKGNTEEAILSATPTFLRNAYKGMFQYPEDGVRARRGYTLVPPEDLSYVDLVRQTFGFTPSKISEAREREWNLSKMQKAPNTLKQRYTARLENLHYDYYKALRANNERDATRFQQKISELVDDIIDYNLNAKPEERITFDLTNIRKNAMLRFYPEGRISDVPKKFRPEALRREQYYEP